MKLNIIKGFNQFVNENHEDEDDDVLNQMREYGLAGPGIAIATPGGDNVDYEIRLDFTDEPQRVEYVWLKDIQHEVDIHDDSNYNNDVIYNALWKRAAELAKLSGATRMVDGDSVEGAKLTDDLLTKRYAMKDINNSL
jgi:hypothetical protein